MIYLDIAMERIVAVHPSNKSSLTYGFLHTRTINPGKASEKSISNAVAQYVLMTLTSKDVKKVRIMRVIRSPKDDARGVAILSEE